MNGASVPASPLASPGRFLYRAVPQSPAVSFRAASGAAPSLNKGLATAPPAAISARHAKSIPDLGQARLGSFDPGRSVVGSEARSSQTSRPASMRFQGGSSTIRPAAAASQASHASQARGNSPPAARQTSPNRQSSLGFTHSSLSAESRGGQRPAAAAMALLGRVGTPVLAVSANSRPRTTPVASPAVAGLVSLTARSPGVHLAPASQAGSVVNVRQMSGESGHSQLSPRRQVDGTPTSAASSMVAAAAAAPVAPTAASAAPLSSSSGGNVSIRTRSLSQGNRKAWGEAVSLQPRVPVLNSTQGSVASAERQQRGRRLQQCSPARQSSMRVPSHTRLEHGIETMADNSWPAAVAAAVSCQDGSCTSAPFVHVRNSLLQDIQSVQRQMLRAKTEAMGQANRITRRSGRAVPQGVSTATVASGSPARSPRVSSRAAVTSPLLPQPASSVEPTTVVSRPTITLSGSRSWVRQPTGQCPQDMRSAMRAAITIQRFWRCRHSERRRRRQGSVSMVVRGSSAKMAPREVARERAPRSSNKIRRRSRPFAPIQYAAARIQRAWKVNKWRRTFVDFSVREIDWLGSLEWLQRRNMLYGTELADEEDVRWWRMQREGAPLDREVDPWGSVKLRGHLHRIYYGQSPEDDVELRIAEAAQHESDPVVQDPVPSYEAAQPQRAATMLAPRRSYPQHAHEPALAANGLLVAQGTQGVRPVVGGRQTNRSRAGSLVMPMTSGKALPLSPRHEQAVMAEFANHGHGAVLKVPLQAAPQVFCAMQPQVHRAACAVMPDLATARLQAAGANATAVMRRGPVTIYTK